jgi:hypothetical protein
MLVEMIQGNKKPAILTAEMASTKLKNIAIVDGIMILLLFVPFFLTHEQAIGYSPYNFLLFQILYFVLAKCLEKNERNSFLLSPSFIAVTYVTLNFLIGSMVFMNNAAVDDLLEPYLKWKRVNLTMGYFNLVNFFIINAYFFSRPVRFPRIPVMLDARRVKPFTLIGAGLAMIVIYSIYNISLTFFSNSESNFYIIPKSLGAILIFVVFFRGYSVRVRIIAYALIIFFFALAAFEDKRDAIFLLLPVLLLESTRYPFTLDLKRFSLLAIGGGFLVYLILVMSIQRGYGSYNARGFVDATGYVDDYVKSDFFIPAFMNNLEISYTYFHSNNAVEHILANPSDLTYGSTIIKPLFIPFPRNYFPQKPESILEKYTSTVSPEKRSEGVSWTISFQSELFWNFSYVGVIVAFFIFIVFNSVYLNVVRLIRTDEIINYIPLLYIYEQLLVLFRGSGLDLFAIDVILSFFIFIILQFLIRLLDTSRRRELT